MKKSLTRRQVYNIIYNEVVLEQSLPFLNKNPDITEKEFEFYADKFSRKANIQAVKNTNRFFNNQSKIQGWCPMLSIHSKEILEVLDSK